ncbi:MAG: hypothetical protein AB1589_22735 [Cyanobacteriota bacterium]
MSSRRLIEDAINSGIYPTKMPFSRKAIASIAVSFCLKILYSSSNAATQPASIPSVIRDRL